MKHLVILALLGLSLIFCSSCRHNRLKTNEKNLAAEINLLENQKKEAEKIAIEKGPVDTLAKIPTGFLYKEDRSLDPTHPPVVVNFSNEISVREVKLSDVASKVNYIILQVPDDSVFFSWRTRLSFSSNKIIVYNILGINLFSYNGEFIETICKNSFIGPRKFDPKGQFATFFGPESFKGAMDTYQPNAGAAGNTVFYKFWDRPGENISLMKYSLNNKTQQLIQPKSSEAGQNEVNYKGENVVSEKMIKSPIDVPGLYYTNNVPISDNCYVGLPSGLLPFGKNGYLMASFNLQGDTLCKFKQFDLPETPISSSVYHTFYNQNWVFGQLTTFKWAFNDTVFRMIPPNRLVPVYVFQLGKHKATAEEWLHVNISRDDKIIIREIHENEHFIFIKYDYYVPGQKQPKSENALFDKSKNELYRVILNDDRKNKIFDATAPNYSLTFGLENDLDNGLPFWPTNVTTEGKLAISLMPEFLIKYIQRPEFMSSNNPKDKAYRDFVQTLQTGGRELIIMFVE